MLKKDFLKTISSLNNLTDEQLEAIERASEADENNVIGAKVKEIHGNYDNDIKTILGVDKPGGVKSYDHLKTQLTSLKAQADKAGNVANLEQQVQTLTTERDNLKTQIANGSTDAALKAELASVQQKLTDKEGELSTFKTTYENEKKTLQDQLNKTIQANTLHLVQNSINQYKETKGLNYKPDLVKSGIASRLIEVEQKEFLASVKTDFVDDGQGGQQLVFRNEAGEIMYNKDNGMKHMTAGDLFFARDGVKNLLTEQRQQAGAGTSGAGSGSGGGSGSTIDLSSAKTQVQADSIIRNHIFKVEGIAKTDPAFDARHAEIRNEHKVADMDVK